MNKQQLASKIWESANKMRSKIEANEYKDYILGFIFYKFLSEKQVSFFKKMGYSADDMIYAVEEEENLVNASKSEIGYFIGYNHLFSTWISKGKDFDVGDVHDALSAFTRLIAPKHQKLFDGIFKTLETGLSKLGDSSANQTRSISDLIHLINDIPMDNRQDYDVLGFIYEYLISNFAANAGKKAGEFYTPHEVSLLMSEIVANHLKDRSDIRIYDPTSGSGSLLINIGRATSKYADNKINIRYYAQELKENTYNLTRMNLVMRGISPYNITTRNGDTLEGDWPYFDDSDPVNTYDPLFVDAVVSNPPYSQQWDPAGKDNDPRFSEYGVAPKSKADYAFLLHDLYHLRGDGIMSIVLPHGVLFRGGEEGEIRKNLIEKNRIDVIIGLPANIFFGTGIPTIIMILKKEKTNTDVLMIDASKGFEKVGKNNRLRSSDIKRITDTVISRMSINKYAKLVSRDEIRNNDYNLNIPRYVDSSEGNESFDIYASMFGGIPESEINELSEYWNAFPSLKSALFKNDGVPYSELNNADIRSVVMNNPDVKGYLSSKYSSVMNSLSVLLENELIGNMQNLDVNKEEAVIADDIFTRIESISLIDKYSCYQLLDDEWNKIEQDLEVIQTEGFDVVRKVDPNIVIKKKDGRDQEVTDGYAGRIIPFELVEKTFLKDEYSELKTLENRLEEIASACTEIAESFDEEDKQEPLYPEGSEEYSAAAVQKEAKRIRKEKLSSDDEESYEYKVCALDSLIKEEKDLKAELKKESAEIQKKTKAFIEQLSDEEAKELLKEKWISPIITSLSSIPDSIINDLISKVQKLSEKYETTYSDIEQQIQNTEKELCSMLDDLTGSDFDMKGLAEFRKLLEG